MTLTDEEIRQVGKQLTQGACLQLSRILVAFLVLLMIIHWARDHFDIGLDDTDFNGRNRSGLILHIDHKTGIEYLSDGRGGLIQRARQ